MKETLSFQGQDVIQITRGDASIRVAPQHGGILLDWSRRGKQIVHWPAAADWSRPTKIRGGNPVLFPFIARHYVDGVLGRWKDEAGIVRDLPMHGFAREMAYAVVETGDPFELRMRITETEKTLAFYPFPFRFELAYRLGEETLEAEFLTTNTGTTPLPYYAGHHFYFNVPHTDRGQWELELPFAKAGRRDEAGNPDLNTVPETTTLADPELVDRFQVGPLRTTFATTNRTTGERITFDLNPPANAIPWYAVTTWSETPESDFFCIEPWLGLPNAIHNGQGLRHVAPGASEKAVCLLRHSSGK